MAGVCCAVALVSGSGDAVAAKERKALAAVRRHDEPAQDPREAPHRGQRARSRGPGRSACSPRRAGGRARRRPRVVITRAREVRLEAGRTRTVRLQADPGRDGASSRAARRRALIANALRLRGERRAARPHDAQRARRSAGTLALPAAAAAPPAPPRPASRSTTRRRTPTAATSSTRPPASSPCPNDHFTVADPTTDTGRRLNLKAPSMPTNRAGKGDRRRGPTTATTASARAR